MTVVRRDHSAAWQRRKETFLERTKARRSSLIERLGGVCVDCGESDESKLEFDHKHDTRTWDCRTLARWSRIKRYEEEADAEQIELRCGTCNKKKGRPPLPPGEVATCGMCGAELPEDGLCMCG